MSAPTHGTTPAVAPMRVIRTSNGVLTLRGYAVRVAVERGELVASDGFGRDRGIGRFTRVQPGFRRVVVIGHAGVLTLEALSWIRDIGAAFVQLSADGSVVATGAAHGPVDVRVRRNQAMAMETGAALTVSRQLLVAKVEGQAAVAARLPDAGPGVADALTAFIQGIEKATTIAEATYAESQAAAHYWNAWGSVRVAFLPRDLRRVPERWLTAGPRHSPLTNEPRLATTPGQALLNYLYGLLEAETRLAIVAVGLDPILGVIHADRPSRDSFVYDVMEPARPHVDAYLLHLLRTRQFARSDFFETRRGVCRLMPTLSTTLTQTMHHWAKVVRPVADAVARAFSHAPSRSFGKPVVMPTGPDRSVVHVTRAPISQRHSNRDSANRRFGLGIADPTVTLFTPQCRSCGSKLSARRRKYCDICSESGAARERAEGIRNTSARRKAAGIADRRSAPDVRTRRWPILAAREEEHRAWEARNGQGPERNVFLREITPALQSAPVNVLIAATGLSKPMCYRIRRGQSVPHWRHWDAIRSAILAYTPPRTKEWERFPEDVFESEIAPALGALPTVAVQAATGWSESYVSLVKRGHYRPHRRHWGVLLELLGSLRPRRG